MKSTKGLCSLLQAKITTVVGATALGMALVLPAAAQDESWIPGNEPPIVTSTEIDVSAAAASASVGSTTVADPSTDVAINHQGANPANILCDAQQGQAREDCLAASSAGGGLQQGSGDGD